MSDQSVQGVNVKISVDNSGVTAGISTAKAQFSSLTSGVQASMASANASLASTGAALDNVAGKTNNLGAAIGATGSRRELSEALSAMRAGADGTAGSFEILRVGLLSFASSLGGPALIAISLVTAALAAGVMALIDYNEEQKQLVETAEALNLPVEQVKNMSTASLTLATQIASVNAGLSKMGSAQFNLLTQMGLDPTSTKSAEEALTTIANSGVDTATKVREVAIAFGGISYDDAQKKLDNYIKTSEQSVASWWETIKLSMAYGADDISFADVQAATQSKGAAAKKNNTGKSPAGNVYSQQQLDAAQSLSDSLLAILNKGSAARISVYTNEAQRIIAEAQQETTTLIQEAAKQAAAQPGGVSSSGGQSIMAAANDSAAKITAAAQQKARQASQQQALQAEQQFQSALTALVASGSQARINAEQSGDQKIIDEGEQKLAALADQYNKDVSNEEQRYAKGTITAQQYNANLLALDQAYSTSAIEINQSTDDKIAAYDQQTNLKRQEYLNTYSKALTSLVKQNGQITADTGTDTNTQIQQQLQDRIDQANELYQKDIDNAKAALNQKLIDQTQYEAEVQALEAQKNKNIDAAYTQAGADQLKQFNTTLNNWTDMTKQMDGAFTQMANATASQLATLVTTGKGSFDAFAQAIIGDLAKVLVEEEVAGLVKMIAGSFGGFSSTGSGVQAGNTGFTAGNGDITMSAAGGMDIGAGVNPVTQLHEKEMVLPADLAQGVRDMVSGSCTSVTMGNGSDGGGSTNVQVNIQNNGTPQQPTQKPQVTQTPQGMVVSIVLDDLKKGGPIASGMQGAYGLKRQG